MSILTWLQIEPGRRGGFRPVGKIGEVGDQVGRPIDAALTQPCGEEAVAAVFGDDLCNERLVGFGGCGAEREADFGQAKLEQAIAARRLAIVLALGGCPADDVDLAIIEAEAAVYAQDLWFDRAIIGQEDAGRAAFDDGRRYCRTFDVGKALGRKHHARVLLTQRL